MLLHLLFASLPTSGSSPIDLGDLRKVVYVGSPRLSPDGSEIAFVVTRNQLRRGQCPKRRSTVWVSPTTDQVAYWYDFPGDPVQSEDVLKRLTEWVEKVWKMSGRQVL